MSGSGDVNPSFLVVDFEEEKEYGGVGGCDGNNHGGGDREDCGGISNGDGNVGGGLSGVAKNLEAFELLAGGRVEKRVCGNSQASSIVWRWRKDDVEKKKTQEKEKENKEKDIAADENEDDAKGSRYVERVIATVPLIVQAGHMMQFKV